LRQIANLQYGQHLAGSRLCEHRVVVMSTQLPLQPERVDVVRLKTSVRLAKHVFTTGQLSTNTLSRERKRADTTGTVLVP